jgi:hypothetical protein
MGNKKGMDHSSVYTLPAVEPTATCLKDSVCPGARHGVLYIACKCVNQRMVYLFACMYNCLLFRLSEQSCTVSSVCLISKTLGRRPGALNMILTNHCSLYKLAIM